MKIHFKLMALMTTSILVNLVLGGCSNTTPCEDILEVKRQEQECRKLQTVMNNPKNPQQALTARKRFQAQCENLRYYRNDYDTICKGEQQPIGSNKTKE